MDGIKSEIKTINGGKEKDNGKEYMKSNWRFVWVIRMEINIRQMKIKNCPDNLFNENMIFNIKEFASNLLEIKKLSFKGVFSVSIYYIK